MKVKENSWHYQIYRDTFKYKWDIPRETSPFKYGWKIVAKPFLAMLIVGFFVYFASRDLLIVVGAIIASMAGLVATIAGVLSGINAVQKSNWYKIIKAKRIFPLIELPDEEH